MSHTPQTKEGTCEVCGASFPIKSEGVCVHPEVLIADTLWDYMNCPACGCQLLLSRRCRDVKDDYYNVKDDYYNVEDDYYNVERLPLGTVFANDEPLAAAEEVIGAEE